MSGLVTNLIALAEGLQARLVTRAEAAERLQVLTDRVPTFVVWAKEMNGQEPVLCYLSTAGRRQDALVEAKRALAKMIGEPVALQVVLAEKEPVLGSKGQERQSATGSLAGLPPELTDDPLVRVAVQELGAVARVL